MRIEIILTEEEICSFVCQSLVPHLGLNPEKYDAELKLVGYPAKLLASFTLKPDAEPMDPDPLSL